MVTGCGGLSALPAGAGLGDRARVGERPGRADGDGDDERAGRHASSRLTGTWNGLGWRRRPLPGRSRR